MTSPYPTAPASRIVPIDALRGLALCGILLINIVDMGGPIAMDRPQGSPSFADPDWLVWWVSQLFVTGTMRGLFSMLFGVGLVIFIGDDDSSDRARLYGRRLLLLFLFGVIDATLLLWPGDILMIYALAGLAAMILHPLKNIQLLAAAGTILAMLSLWAAFEALTIAPADMVYTAAMLRLEAAARLGSYGQAFDYLSWVSWNWTVNAITYRWVGDALAFMLVGIVLHRKGLFAPSADAGLLRNLLRFGYAIGLPLRLLHAALVFAHDGSPTFASALIEQAGRIAMTLGHVGLFLLLWRRADMPRRLAPLTAMGRMALTLYLSQSLFAAFIFSGFGLGLWNALSWPTLWLVALAILAVQALFATAWLDRYRYGPVEWLWRWGTYGRRSMMARDSV